MSLAEKMSDACGGPREKHSGGTYVCHQFLVQPLDMCQTNGGGNQRNLFPGVLVRGRVIAYDGVVDRDLPSCASHITQRRPCEKSCCLERVGR